MNWHAIPYRKRNAAMVVGVIVFALIAYFTTIRKTVVLYTETKRMTENAGHVQGSFAQLHLAEKKYKDLSSYLDLYVLDSTRNQQYIMSQVSDLCKTYNLILRSFPMATVQDENALRVETNVIETAGSFTNQVKLLYALETAHIVGRVSSVRYSTYIDNKNKKVILLSTIYLQNVRSHDKTQL